ncbi:hypothetical protein GCM10020258_40320 [Sphingomonas yabuuchiae]
MRWVICGLLFAAVVLSYIDRLVLGVLKPQLTALYGWTNSGYGDITGYFQVAYGLGFLLFGWLIDRIGPRTGYLLAMGAWTVGHFAQTLVTSTTGFALARIPLALGEAGTFPRHWRPPRNGSPRRNGRWRSASSMPGPMSVRW